jgi:hypothetical protein
MHGNLRTGMEDLWESSIELHAQRLRVRHPIQHDGLCHLEISTVLPRDL